MVFFCGLLFVNLSTTVHFTKLATLDDGVRLSGRNWFPIIVYLRDRLGLTASWRYVLQVLETSVGVWIVTPRPRRESPLMGVSLDLFFSFSAPNNFYHWLMPGDPWV